MFDLALPAGQRFGKILSVENMILLYFGDSTSTVFSSDALPTEPLILADWKTARLHIKSTYGSDGDRFFNDHFSIEADITSVRHCDTL